MLDDDADCDLEASSGAAFKFELERLNKRRPKPLSVPTPPEDFVDDIPSLVSFESCETALGLVTDPGRLPCEANLVYSASLDSSVVEGR